MPIRVNSRRHRSDTPRVGTAYSTIYEQVNLNKFPKPIKIGRRNEWRGSTVIKFLDRLDYKAGILPSKT